MIMHNFFKSPAASAGAIRLGVVPSGFAPKFSSAFPPGGLENAVQDHLENEMSGR
jgi:hypothetical protein